MHNESIEPKKYFAVINVNYCSLAIANCYNVMTKGNSPH